MNAPLTYLSKDRDRGSEGFDVYRCENGSQAWQVAQGISEASARVIAALLAGEILVKQIAYEQARCEASTKDTLAMADDPESEYTHEQVAPWIEGYQRSRDERIALLRARAFIIPAQVPLRD